MKSLRRRITDWLGMTNPITLMDGIGMNLNIERGEKEMTKQIDWQSLNGKTLRIIIAQPNNTVIGINEETNESFVLHQDITTVLRSIELEGDAIEHLKEKVKRPKIVCG